MPYKDIDKIPGIQGFYVKVFRRYKKCIITHIKNSLNDLFFYKINSQKSLLNENILIIWD